MYLGLFFGLGAAVKALMRVTKAYKRASAQEDEADSKAGDGSAGSN